jgi:hypothetical protein
MEMEEEVDKDEEERGRWLDIGNESNGPESKWSKDEQSTIKQFFY